MASAEPEGKPGAQEGPPPAPPQLAEAMGGRVQSSEETGAWCQPMKPAGPRVKISAPQDPSQSQRSKRADSSWRKRGSSQSLPGPSHQAHLRTEAELPPGLPLQREEPEGSQSEPSPSAKQHKKSKKRKSLGAPVLPAVASTASAPSETLGLERKAQRLRPLYQYINYCNPELNQAGEGDREAEVDVEPESELALAPEEAAVEQLQVLLPIAGELGSGLTVPCTTTFLAPTQGQEAGEEPGGLPNLGVSGCLKAEVDKSTQVDIDKMLSVCAAPLVPPLSPQYK